jgi:hypothetical protein
MTIQWSPLYFDGAPVTYIFYISNAAYILLLILSLYAYKVEGYEVQMRGVLRGDARKWRVVNVNVQETTYRVPHLLPAFSYRFRVCAINKYGTGLPCVASEIFTLLDGINMHHKIMLTLSVNHELPY